MIYSHQIRSLSENELALLLFSLNDVFREKQPFEITPHFIKFYKKNILKDFLNYIKDKLKDEHKELIDSIVFKLEL